MDLPNLTFFEAGHNQIADLELLWFLITLRNVLLHHNNIQNVEPLNQLNNLSYLNLSHSQITTIDTLKTLKRVQDFDGRSNPLHQQRCPFSTSTIFQF